MFAYQYSGSVASVLGAAGVQPPTGHHSSGPFAWVAIVVVLAIIAFVVLRNLSRRR